METRTAQRLLRAWALMVDALKDLPQAERVQMINILISHLTEVHQAIQTKEMTDVR
jgi:hypothetical protein